MLIIRKQKFKCKIDVVLLANSNKLKTSDCDIRFFMYATCNYPKCRIHNTLLFDLGKDEDTLFKEMSTKLRNMIKRSYMNYNFKYHLNMLPTTDNIKEFIDFYNLFAKDKGLDLCDEDYLYELQKENKLIITHVTDEESKKILCIHLYIHDAECVLCWHSVSHFRLAKEQHFRNMISFANRFLHWEDMKTFKANGFTTYDFGGLFLEKDVAEKHNIDRFKLAFGGEIVQKYEYYMPNNLKGRVAIWANRIKNSVRNKTH